MSLTTEQHIERVARLYVTAMEQDGWAFDFTNGQTAVDHIPNEHDPLGDHPFYVVQTDNEGHGYIASAESYNVAARCAESCVYQTSGKYAWWPVAIIDIERDAFYPIEVEVNVRAIPCHVCGTLVSDDVIVWSRPDGSLSTDDGNPYCDACLPPQEVTA